MSPIEELPVPEVKVRPLKEVYLEKLFSTFSELTPEQRTMISDGKFSEFIDNIKDKDDFQKIISAIMGFLQEMGMKLIDRWNQLEVACQVGDELKRVPHRQEQRENKACQADISAFYEALQRHLTGDVNG